MKKILVVDDELDIRELLAQGIKRAGYETEIAGDGEAALSLCERQQFDLILIDIAMPGMDGYETCRRLRKEEKTRTLPVIFLTGKELSPQGIQERFQELGASGYLQKPSSMSDVLAKIKDVLGE
ncbi:MAG: response regulator [Candidatus Omnitrophica bacterium]|nr:response regulator [Candidatus Omnitrophota bacterium]